MRKYEGKGEKGSQGFLSVQGVKADPWVCFLRSSLHLPSWIKQTG